jgi:hypothetical protein
MGNFHVLGQLVDISNREIFSAEISVEKGKIVSIRKVVEDKTLPFLLPGFIDAHVHIESSMLVPSEFARLAVPHGTVATVSDPHEIANVCGMEGINYMIDNGKPDSLQRIEDEFIHTQFFALVDKYRRVRGIYDGLKEEEIQKLMVDIKGLMKETVAPKRFMSSFSNNPN